MNNVPPTYLSNSAGKLAKVREQLAEEETYWQMQGVPLRNIEYPWWSQFAVQSKMMLAFEMLRELTGKTEDECDLRLCEIMLELLKEMRPTMEEMAKQARAAAILQGVPLEGLPNDGSESAQRP